MQAFKPVFLRSAARPGDFPADIGREVAVAGRSNSGKSSAINAIVGVRKLARVSKTPGRTRMINFFELARHRRIVDLPGYGFARVPLAMREQWRRLIDAYFGGRDSLSGLIVTVDIRRGLAELDRTMLALAHGLDVPTALLLTKIDKLSRGAAASKLRQIDGETRENTVLVPFSAVSRAGVDEARTRLARWLDVA